VAGFGVDRGSGSSPGGVADLASDTGSTLVGHTPTTGALAGVAHTVASFLDKLGNAGANLGAALVGFVQSGTGARTDETMQEKARQIIHVEDFKNDDGTAYAGDGVQDDTTAFSRARTAAVGRTLHITGTPLISSAISLTDMQHWVFDGPVGNSASRLPGSYLIKKSTINGDFVTFASGSDGSLIEKGGLQGEVGNGGDGYVIKANGVKLVHPFVTLMGQDGIRVGSDAAGTNANSFRILEPTCLANVRHGIYVNDDNSSDVVDANAGLIDGPFTDGNGGDGIKIDRGEWNTIIAPLSTTNTGAGINLATNALSNTVVGGDAEGNTEDITIAANATGNALLNVNYTTITDSGLNTLLFGYEKTKVPGIVFGVASNGSLHAFDAGDTTPSVSGRTLWQTANTGSTTITDFDDGVNGQVIVVRLDANTGITRNTSLIRLAGFSSIAVGAVNSDFLISFVSISGIWFELGRTIDYTAGAATFNPADLADGAGETTTVTVTGAALGDFAAASFSLDLQGILLTAWVSATNTVSVRFQNETGGNINLAEGTLRARVFKA
jgi:hypothetical protein